MKDKENFNHKGFPARKRDNFSSPGEDNKITRLETEHFERQKCDNSKQNKKFLEIKPGSARQRRIYLARACELIANGMRDLEACMQLSEEFEIGHQQAKNCIEEAYAQLENDAQSRPRPQRLGVAICQREEILKLSIMKKDFRTALAAADSREKLLGLSVDNEEDSAASSILAVAQMAGQYEGEMATQEGGDEY